MKRPRYALTLIELLIALSMFAVLVLTATSFQLFGRNQMVTAQQRSRLQNDLTYLISRMKIEGLHAIGTVANDVATGNIGGFPSLEFYIDANGNGVRDASPPDRWVAFVHRTDLSEVWFYPDAAAAAHEMVVTRITNVGWALPVAGTGSTIVTIVAMTAANDPLQACDGLNPCVRMDAAIALPSISN